MMRSCVPVWLLGPECVEHTRQVAYMQAHGSLLAMMAHTLVLARTAFRTFMVHFVLKHHTVYMCSHILQHTAE